MGLSAEEFAAKKAEVAAEKIAAKKASNQTATQAATNQTASLAAAAEGSTDTNHATHNSYVGIRRRAMGGECEWPDDGDWPLDLFVELTDPSRISIMQRPFGEVRRVDKWSREHCCKLCNSLLVSLRVSDISLLVFGQC